MAIRYSGSLDRVFHALGNASRRQILATLSLEGSCSAGELGKLFSASQPTVSKHLRVMEEAGLIERRVAGRQHLFEMRAGSLTEAQSFIERHLSLWNASLDRLAQLLDEEAESE